MFVSMEITVKEKDEKDITRQNSKTNCKIQRVIIIARMGNENTGYFLEFYMRNFNQNFYQVTAAAYRKPVSHRIFLLHDLFFFRSYFPCCQDPVQTGLHALCRSCPQNTAAQWPHPW